MTTVSFPTTGNPQPNVSTPPNSHHSNSAISTIMFDNSESLQQSNDDNQLTTMPVDDVNLGSTIAIDEHRDENCDVVLPLDLRTSYKADATMCLDDKYPQLEISEKEAAKMSLSVSNLSGCSNETAMMVPLTFCECFTGKYKEGQLYACYCNPEPVYIHCSELLALDTAEDDMEATLLYGADDHSQSNISPRTAAETVADGKEVGANTTTTEETKTTNMETTTKKDEITTKKAETKRVTFDIGKGNTSNQCSGEPSYMFSSFDSTPPRLFIDTSFDDSVVKHEQEELNDDRNDSVLATLADFDKDKTVCIYDFQSDESLKTLGTFNSFCNKTFTFQESNFRDGSAKLSIRKGRQPGPTAGKDKPVRINDFQSDGDIKAFGSFSSFCDKTFTFRDRPAQLESPAGEVYINHTTHVSNETLGCASTSITNALLLNDTQDYFADVSSQSDPTGAKDVDVTWCVKKVVEDDESPLKFKLCKTYIISDNPDSNQDSKQQSDGANTGFLELSSVPSLTQRQVTGSSETSLLNVTSTSVSQPEVSVQHENNVIMHQRERKDTIASPTTSQTCARVSKNRTPEEGFRKEAVMKNANSTFLPQFGSNAAASQRFIEGRSLCDASAILFASPPSACASPISVVSLPSTPDLSGIKVRGVSTMANTPSKSREQFNVVNRNASTPNASVTLGNSNAAGIKGRKIPLGDISLRKAMFKKKLTTQGSDSVLNIGFTSNIEEGGDEPVFSGKDKLRPNILSRAKAKLATRASFLKALRHKLSCRSNLSTVSVICDQPTPTHSYTETAKNAQEEDIKIKPERARHFCSTYFPVCGTAAMTSSVSVSFATLGDSNQMNAMPLPTCLSNPKTKSSSCLANVAEREVPTRQCSSTTGRLQNCGTSTLAFLQTVQAPLDLTKPSKTDQNSLQSRHHTGSSCNLNQETVKVHTAEHPELHQSDALNLSPFKIPASPRGHSKSKRGKLRKPHVTQSVSVSQETTTTTKTRQSSLSESRVQTWTTQQVLDLRETKGNAKFVGELLSAFISDVSLSQFGTQMKDRQQKAMLYYLCEKCGIRVKNSKVDSSVVILIKSRHSRPPGEDDVKQLVRQARRKHCPLYDENLF